LKAAVLVLKAGAVREDLSADDPRRIADAIVRVRRREGELTVEGDGSC
jgi:hypothetical protein